MKILNNLLSILTIDLAIDVGTANTVICRGGVGAILCEPSCIAVSYPDGEVVCVGKEAYELMGRASPQVEVLRPLEKGFMENFDLAEEMLKELLRGIFKRKALMGARMSVVVPAGATDVQKKAFEELAIQVGGREVFLVEAPVAAALASWQDVLETPLTLSLHLGAGAAQFAAFASGEMIFSISDSIGGEEITDSIINGIKKEKKIIIGRHTAEQLKSKTGAVPSARDSESCEIFGKKIDDGLPARATITNGELREMSEHSVEKIGYFAASALNRMSPEMSEQAGRSRFLLSGGSSLMHGIPKLLQEHTGLESVFSRDALAAAARGAEAVLNDMKKFGKFTTSSHGRTFED